MTRICDQPTSTHSRCVNGNQLLLSLICFNLVQKCKFYLLLLILNICFCATLYKDLLLSYCDFLQCCNDKTCCGDGHSLDFGVWQYFSENVTFYVWAIMLAVSYEIRSLQLSMWLKLRVTRGKRLTQSRSIFHLLPKVYINLWFSLNFIVVYCTAMARKHLCLRSFSMGNISEKCLVTWACL
jgi:hypothetical protein